MQPSRTSWTNARLVAAILLTTACGQSPVEPEPIAEALPADMDTFFSTVPTWEAFSPPQPDTSMAVGDSTTAEVVLDGQDHICTTTPYSLTRTPEDIVTLKPDNQLLWVGGLLQGRGYAGGIGSLRELPVRQRAPIDVSIDLLTGDNTRRVEDPSLASVNSAVGELIQAAADAGHTAGSDVYFSKTTAHSFVQAALEMGMSGNYAAASMEAELGASASLDSRTVTAYFAQRMFTASMVAPQTPGAVFSDAFTQELLEEQVALNRMGPSNPPVYVSNVTYGRILMFSMTSTAAEAKMHAAVKAMYGAGGYGGGAWTDAELEAVVANSSIEVVAIGGDAANALDLIRGNDLGAYFTDDAPLTTGRPISYTVTNLSDNSIAKVSETTEYDLETCAQVEPEATGAVYRFEFTKMRVGNLPLYIDPLFNQTIELDYLLSVESEGVFHTAAWGGWDNPRPFGSDRVWAEELREQSWHAPVQNQPATKIEVTIHFDGRDEVRIRGEVWDVDNAAGAEIDGGWEWGDDVIGSFDERYHWPTRPISEGTHSRLLQDAAGDQVTVYWKFTKVRDLID